MKPKDYTKHGILNWICIQEDLKDVDEVLKMCVRKINAISKCTLTKPDTEDSKNEK